MVLQHVVHATFSDHFRSAGVLAHVNVDFLVSQLGSVIRCVLILILHELIVVLRVNFVKKPFHNDLDLIIIIRLIEQIADHFFDILLVFPRRPVSLLCVLEFDLG